MRGDNRSKLFLVLSMALFGTIGIFRKYIPLPSSLLAMSRGFIGMFFLLLVVAVRKQRPSWTAIKRNLLLLCISGVLIGFNWILLFEAYRYTTVATATLCYYMAPVFVILVSPFFFKERLTPKKILCIIVSLVGMVLVSGILQSGFVGVGELKGVLLGLGAAVLYASVIVLNKKFRDISAYDRTIVQLGAAAVVLIPYTLLTEELTGIVVTPFVVVMLIIVGVVHTGTAYALYFGSVARLKAQTIALFSYIDPVVAIILSAVLLREQIGVWGVVGAVLILGSTLISELPERKKQICG